jgi:uncharacterized phiE125 gp8 family phage protein
MGYRLITAPESLPVTLAEAKAQLRVDHTDEDALITRLVKAATAYLDGRTGILGRCLVTQTWELTLDAFPAEEIELPLGPVQSVTSVKYVDTAGVTQTVPEADYYLDNASISAWVMPQIEWPDTMEAANAVTVRYVAGTAPAAVPDALRHAILVMVSAWYDKRAAGDMPLAAGALIAPHRVIAL